MSPDQQEEPTRTFATGANRNSAALKQQVAGSHYSSMAIQPVEFILANAIPFIEGCVIKYVSRWRDKGGIQDLEKARHFLDILIEHEVAQQKRAGEEIRKLAGERLLEERPLNEAPELKGFDWRMKKEPSD